MNLYNSLLQYRTQIMGISMIFILFHHMPGYLPSILNFIRVNSGIGVDIFFFLSGFGIFLSLRKDFDILYFYKKRCLRIFLAYIVIVFCYNLVIGEGKLDIISTMWQVSTIGLWLYKGCYDWYIPALVVLYVFSPIAFMFLMNKSSIKWFLFPSILVILLISYGLGFNYINIFFPRIPVFLLGFSFPLLQEYIRKKINKLCIYAIVIFGGFTGLYIESILYQNFDFFFRNGFIYFPYLLIVPLLLLVIIKICSVIPKSMNLCLSFIGGITLEVYLIHLR